LKTKNLMQKYVDPPQSKKLSTPLVEYFTSDNEPGGIENATHKVSYDLNNN
jgi:hypothetical protein